MPISFAILLLPLLISSPSSAQTVEQHPVKKHQTRHWGSGYLIAIMQKTVKDKNVFLPGDHTLEVELGFGSMPSDARYPGHAINVSLDLKDEKLFNRIENLNSKKAYIFKYIHKYPLNPEVENSKLQIKEVYEVGDDFLKSGLPTEMTITYGDITQRQPGKKNGRIVDVERWGNGGHKICTIQLEMGGIAASAESGTNVSELNVTSEEGCVYAEKLLFYGVEVEIHYGQQFFEMWDGNPRAVHKIRVTDTANAARVVPLAPSAKPESIDSEYERFKDRLLNDTSFTNELIRRSSSRPRQ